MGETCREPACPVGGQAVLSRLFLSLRLLLPLASTLIALSSAETAFLQRFMILLASSLEYSLAILQTPVTSQLECHYPRKLL